MLQEVLKLLSHGWLPIPIPAGQKNPVLNGWQKLRLTEAELPTYFNNGQNVGLLLGLPSGGLIDIDLDWPEARTVADFFLPSTNMESGRKNSPRSHRWYCADPIPKTKKFEDPALRDKPGERATIIELRSTGAQTLVPPSRHPSGELYEWYARGLPTKIEGNVLLEKVGCVAACAITARYWQEGKRHDLALALAGMLFRSGWVIEDIERFIIIAAQTAGDEEIQDRQRAVRDTSEQLANGRCSTGFIRLSELMPKDVANCIVRWLGLQQRSSSAPLDGKAENSESIRRVKPSKATLLVELASDTQLFHTSDGEAFARIEIENHYENWAVKSKSFKRWLAHRFFSAYKTAPGAQTIQDALAVIEGKAQFDSPERAIYTRIAEYRGGIYLDLANESWQAVEITHNDWRVIDTPPVFFRRPAGMLPLPLPIRGGSIVELRQFINIQNDDDWALLTGWMIGSFNPDGPYPVLVLHGEQGSAKSTAARVLRSFIDPNAAGLRSEPRDARDLMIAAKNGRIISLDNLSTIPIWLSDALCRLSTGGGFATRELYSDVEEVLFEAKRPVILNGIEELATRGDLLDRCIILYLPPISEQGRLAESEFWSKFEKAQPRILGALLNATSNAIRNLPNVALLRRPRLADFAMWAAAAEPALGLKQNQFINAYAKNRESANSLALDASVVATVVIIMMESIESWSGTATELLKELNCHVDEDIKRQQGWPRRGSTLSNKLRRLVPNLRAIGIAINFERKGSKRIRTISIEKDCKRSSASSACSKPTEKAQQGADDARTQTDDHGRKADDVSAISDKDRGNTKARKTKDQLNGADDADDADAELQPFLICLCSQCVDCDAD